MNTVASKSGLLPLQLAVEAKEGGRFASRCKHR
jgi:hypothetical protein